MRDILIVLLAVLFTMMTIVLFEIKSMTQQFLTLVIVLLGFIVFYMAIDKVHIFNEKDLSDESLYDYSKNFRDKHSDDYLSNKYLIHQLSKLDISTRLVDCTKYDAVILVRDDLYFYNKVINWDFVLYLINFGPVVSKWFWNGGASERFVVAKPKDALKIATRISLVKESID